MPQAKQVLSLDHGQICHAGPDTAHHAPMIALLPVQAEVGNGIGHTVLGGGIEPSHKGLVVVGTGVGYTVAG